MTALTAYHKLYWNDMLYNIKKSPIFFIFTYFNVTLQGLWIY